MNVHVNRRTFPARHLTKIFQRPGCRLGAPGCENMHTLNAQSGGECLSQRSGSSLTPRVCMPTWRGFARMPFQCNRYEAQDVLCGLDTVDLIALESLPGFCFRERWLRKLIWKDMTRQLVYV